MHRDGQESKRIVSPRKPIGLANTYVLFSLDLGGLYQLSERSVCAFFILISWKNVSSVARSSSVGSVFP